MLENHTIKLIKADPKYIGIYHKWRNDYDVMKFTSLHLQPYKYEETENFFINKILTADSYMIYSKEFNKIAGITSLTNIDLINRNAEFIIDIGEKDCWNKGIATEAIKMILSYAFMKLNLHKVYLRVFSLNERGIHLYRKIGFHIEGTQREMLYRDHTWHDIVYMSL